MIVEAVIGANYGDEGKGLFTDYLCKNRPNPMVIMANGGSQRGHTVELEDGIRHVFHHFGSGTFRNALTYFPKQYLLNPMQFVKEYEELEKMNCKPMSFHHPYCILQLPCDIALNWHIEKSRGESKHGSVGCGIWETKYRMYNGDAWTFDKFCRCDYNKQVEYIKSQAMKYRDLRCKEEGLSSYADIYDLFMSEGFIDHFISDCMAMMRCCHSVSLNSAIGLQNAKTLVFECGQGLRLDQFYGAADESNTTPSFTGANGIARMLNEERVEVTTVNLNYISRTYLTKHGAGKFVESKETFHSDDFCDETNVWNEWQDELRYAALDYDEMIARCAQDVKMFKKFFTKDVPIKMNIAMTHANEISIDEEFVDKISFMSDTKFSNDIHLV